MWWLLLIGCGPKEMRPQGPVLDAPAVASFVGSASPAVYTSERRSEVPAIPVMPWGAHYDLDLVLVSQHPDWNMHELARLSTPGGPVWVAKDAREPTRSQSIVADVPDIDTFMPELPVPRVAGMVEVADRSRGRRLDLTVSYVNIDGVPVVVGYRGPAPRTELRKRNGSTMGHSRDVLLATLDLPRRDLARSATISFDGEVMPLARIAGVVPFALALEQTQAGLASGSYASRALASGGVQTVFETAGRPVAVDWGFADDALRTTSEVRDLEATFRPGTWETTELSAHAWDREEPLVQVSFEPALPDLSRTLASPVVGRFLIQTNGQPANAVGRYEVVTSGESNTLTLQPEAPWWVVDRPMQAVHTPDGHGGMVSTVTMLPAP